MNWAAISAIASVITVLIVLAGGGAMWGTMTERVSGLTDRVEGNQTDIAQIGVRLTQHDVQLGRLEEWKSGYNAAARVSGRTPEVA
jgi:hypothetical protein